MGKAAAIDGVVERLMTRIAQQMRVDALILFGSRVNGQPDEWSDYDFVVVSPDFEGVPFLERGCVLLPLREKGVSYDFLCYTPREFEELSSQLTVVGEAAREGIRLI